MTTPRAVREASQRADAIHAEAYTPDEEAPSRGEGEPEPEESSPPQEQAPSPEPPAPQPEPAKEDTAEFWRNKFNTLEGKYRAEVPRLSQDLRGANSRIQQLEQTLANLSNNRQQDDTKSLVTAEEVEEYGEDFVAMMRRLAQEEAGRAVSKVAPRLQEVEGQLQRDRAQTAVNRVYAMLDSNVEDWRTVNRSPEFLEWLKEEDPFAGAPRSDLLRDAFGKGDAGRVLTFFQTYLNQKTLIEQPPQQPSPAQPGVRVKPKVSLEDLAGPRSSGAAVAPKSNGEGQIQQWTRRQIAAFYKDVQTGHYANNPDDRDRIERSINRAMQAGLITP